MLDSAILDKEENKEFIGNTGFKTAEELLAIVENAPVNILIADRDLRLTYLNPQSVTTLKTLEHLLPKPVDKLAGESIDIFHQNPEFQRKLLDNDKNLPHKAMIKLGDETLDLEVTAVYDANKKYVGPMVTWEVVTEKLKIDGLIAQKDSMLSGAPINIMMADKDLNLVFLNPKSTETLKTLEKYLPKPVDQLVGESIDIFHKNPEVQRRLLKDDSQLPYNQIISVGPEKLDLLVSATYDDQGNYSGPMVTWEVVTKKLEGELEMARKDALVTNAPVNLMMADLDYNLIYLNPKAKATLRTLEAHLPKPVDQLVGEKIDIFHKNPDKQRKLLADDRNLPFQGVIEVGPEKLDLLVSATYDGDNNYMGPMVNWSVITDRLELIDNLEQTSQTLASSSEELISTANSMLENSKNTSQGAVNASAAAEEVTAGITTVSSNTEEMKASIGEIARSSAEAANKSKLSLEQARDANSIITKLGDSSQEIGNVIKVISSIAQQTNLLALNATIEAARAGDAGKGFAVVANEVKELAKQTAKATEDITNKIQNIQTDSNDAVSSIGEISTAIEELNNISVSIAASIEEQTATTNEVARVVVESTNSVNQISEIIKNVAEVAGQTQQGSEGTVTSAQDLQKMAESLKSLVEKIKNDE